MKFPPNKPQIFPSDREYRCVCNFFMDLDCNQPHLHCKGYNYINLLPFRLNCELRRRIFSLFYFTFIAARSFIVFCFIVCLEISTLCSNLMLHHILQQANAIRYISLSVANITNCFQQKPQSHLLMNSAKFSN